MTPLTGERVKNPKKSTTFEHILLKGHGASFEYFCDSLERKQQIWITPKRIILIKRDQAELDRNIYSYPWELFDWLLS